MKTMATIERLNDDLKANWTRYNYNKSYSDQFGNCITGEPGNYTLQSGHNTIKGLHCINSAKEIAKILVNDKFV